MTSDPLLLNSITDARENAKGRVAICGSHGGMIAGLMASRAGLKAVILNDAGIGFERAGIAGAQALGDVGMAGATVSCMSAEIGSAQDMLANGVISYANEIALKLGVEAGEPVRNAARKFAAAPEPAGILPPQEEQRWDADLGPDMPPILCVDSASLIKPGDAGRIIVTGSHGGLIGGDPARACKADARFVCFSDAGFGKNDVGIARLPALAARGIAAVTVSCESCAIGDAQSALENGVISAVNEVAERAGTRKGMRLFDALSAYG